MTKPLAIPSLLRDLGTTLRHIESPTPVETPPKPPTRDHRTTEQVLHDAASRAATLPQSCDCPGPSLRLVSWPTAVWECVPEPTRCPEPHVRACEAWERALLARRVSAVGVPSRYASTGLLAAKNAWAGDARPYEPQTSVQGAALGAVAHWANTTQPGGRGLYLQGPRGTGKTHLLCAAGLWLASQGVDVRYVDWGLWLSDHRGIARAQEVSRLIAHPVLLIDDADRVPQESQRESVVSAVEAIVTQRYDAGRTTCLAVTTDRKANELYSAPVASRLWECCTLVRLDGGDYRQRGRM